jgi:putative sterol carrier protein
VSNEDAEADCTLSISIADFKSMASGELDPTTAFMMGKLKVDGDMTVAFKLQKVF